MNYDAVVIGAGHNGLAAAVELAKKGWSVAVVEANAEPGGAVKTREVTLSDASVSTTIFRFGSK